MCPTTHYSSRGEKGSTLDMHYITGDQFQSLQTDTHRRGPQRSCCGRDQPIHSWLPVIAAREDRVLFITGERDRDNTLLATAELHCSTPYTVNLSLNTMNTIIYTYTHTHTFTERLIFGRESREKACSSILCLTQVNETWPNFPLKVCVVYSKGTGIVVWVYVCLEWIVPESHEWSWARTMGGESQWCIVWIASHGCE